jgi:hypothetical protein
MWIRSSFKLTIERNVFRQLDERNVILDFANVPAWVIDRLGFCSFQSVSYLVLIVATRADVMGSQSDVHFDGSTFSERKVLIHISNCFFLDQIPNSAVSGGQDPSVADEGSTAFGNVAIPENHFQISHEREFIGSCFLATNDPLFVAGLWRFNVESF